ncbi:DUF4365 domain-containing protein [Sorangium sp. So ce327]|uniref:DUF4365 domain-containing protein n=1 Tax=Sorangium sp. So ce327 TaxID=3133301 RepID=UPI003F602D6A
MENLIMSQRRTPGTHTESLASRRLSAQKRQEQRSLGQIQDCFSDWNVNRFSEDLGEDLIVQIYDDGRSTGLSFYFQVKSVQDIEAYVLRRSPATISYREIEVKDLLHWIDSTPPVIVMLWDVNRHTGVWQDVPSIVKALDKRSPGWRRRKRGKVSVEFPRAHTTDEAGRSALRKTVAHIALPQIAAGRKLKLKPTFLFKNTPEGKVVADAFRRALDEGGAVTIDAEYIKSVRFSDWWERAHGSATVSSITISSVPSQERVRFGFRAVSPTHTETVYLEMRRLKAGRKQSTFTTADSMQPLDARLTISFPKERRVTFSFSFEIKPAPNVAVALSLTRFALAIHATSEVFVILPGGVQLGPVGLPAGNLEPDQITLRSWEALLQRLSFVQARISRFGTFDLSKGIHERELPEIGKLFSACTGTPWDTVLDFEFDLADDAPIIEYQPGAGPVSIEIDPFGDAHLLNVTIPLGHATIEFLSSESFVESYNKSVRNGRRSIHLDDAAVRICFRDWNPPRQGPEPPLLAEKLISGGSI